MKLVKHLFVAAVSAVVLGACIPIPMPLPILHSDQPAQQR